MLVVRSACALCAYKVVAGCHMLASCAHIWQRAYNTKHSCRPSILLGHSLPSISKCCCTSCELHQLQDLLDHGLLVIGQLLPGHSSSAGGIAIVQLRFCSVAKTRHWLRPGRRVCAAPLFIPLTGPSSRGCPKPATFPRTTWLLRKGFRSARRSFLLKFL